MIFRGGEDRGEENVGGREIREEAHVVSSKV